MKRFRINMIVGKKQIIIAGLTLLLGISIFANYALSSARKAKAVDGSSGDSGYAGEVSSLNYGDAQFVSSSAVVDDADAFFASARLSKQQSRDEAKEFLQSMVGGGDVLTEEIEVIARDAAALGGYIESEAKIESILKAQGFGDVLCYISDRGANIIVRTDGLTAQDAAKIKDALISEVSVSPENITIVEVK